MSTNQNAYGKAYQDRVQRLFDRVNSIQKITKEDKKVKIQDLERVVKDLETKILSQRKEKNTKISTFRETIKTMQDALELESQNREKLENGLNSQINNLDKNCAKILEDAKYLRDDTDRNLVTKLNNSIDLLQEEISKNLMNKNFEKNEELEQLMEKDLPKIQYELANESAMRKELENKILDQFMNQIGELNNLLVEEKKKREIKEEEILNGINTISKDIENSLQKQREEREKNEENILELVEKVIDRLKTDISDY